MTSRLFHLFAAAGPEWATWLLVAFALLSAALIAIEAAPEGPRAVEQAVASVIARERPRYERWLSLLATVGATAPVMGLLGTAIGVLQALTAIAHRAPDAPLGPAVAAAISEALSATVAGLLVSIPTLVASRGFRRRLGNALARAETLSHAYAGFLRRQTVAAVQMASAPVAGMRARRRYGQLQH